MGKCKVRVCRLTLAPSSLGCSVQREKEVDQDAEEDRLRDRELLHNALEVAIASTSSQKIHPHIHGVVNKVGGDSRHRTAIQRPTTR
jgi:hypothetical protein